MKFTYKAYSSLINLLQDKSYQFSFFGRENLNEKIVLMRHDIDLCLEKALEIAKLEYNKGVKATYFAMLSTEFYNLNAKKHNRIIREIIKMGHEVGLHFDVKNYDVEDLDQCVEYVHKEIKSLEKIIGAKVHAVSMHRPMPSLLESNLNFKTVVNTYSNKYFKDMCYVSDSRMHWRRDVFKIIESNEERHLQILTHPIWYSEHEEILGDKLTKFIEQARYDRHVALDKNFRDLDQVIDCLVIKNSIDE